MSRKETERMATKKKFGKIVLIRSNMSGVWIGYLKSKKDNEVTLTNALKIWRWRGANTTSELAMYGCDSNGYTRVAEPTAEVVVSDVCEIHLSSKKVFDRLAACGWSQ